MTSAAGRASCNRSVPVNRPCLTSCDEYHMLLEYSAAQRLRDQCQRMFTGDSRMVQAFMWQMHLKFIVLRDRDCLSGVVATTAAADSDVDSTSNQP